MDYVSRTIKRLNSYPIKWVLPVSLSLVAVPVVSQRWQVQNQSVQTAATVSALPVDTIAVEPIQDYQATRVYTGETVARRKSELGFERAGQVVEVLVDEGDLIQPGAPLARLDVSLLETEYQQLLAQRSEAIAKLQELQTGARPEEIAIAQAQVAEITEQLSLEQTKRQRRENLYLEGAISREQLDEVSTESNRLVARLSQAQNQLDELRAGPREEQIAAQAAAVEQLNARLASLDVERSKSVIRAPFSGTIAGRLIDEGTVVASGQPVLQLIENSALEARIGIPVASANQLQVGSQHQLQIGQRGYKAEVTSLQPELDTTTRTVTAVLQLEPDRMGSLVPGQLVDLKLAETIASSGYWLPTTALAQGTQGLWYCYVLAASDVTEQPSATPADSFVVQRSEVEVLHTEGDRALVRGTIQPGDRVIESGLHRVTPGQYVRPADTTARAAL